MILRSKIFDRWFRLFVHVGSLLPLVVLIFDAWRGNLTADPIRGAILRTGKIALVLLVLCLACTPLNTIFGFKPALRVRRALGDYSFLYASLHFAIYVGLDYGFNFSFLSMDIFKPYALVGLVAGLLLIPLAITSFGHWQQRLGKNWKRLHSMIYLIAALVALHFILLVKQGVIEPWLWAILIAILLLVRLPPIRRFLSGFFTRQE